MVVPEFPVSFHSLLANVDKSTVCGITPSSSISSVRVFVPESKLKVSMVWSSVPTVEGFTKEICPEPLVCSTWLAVPSATGIAYLFDALAPNCNSPLIRKILPVVVLSVPNSP